MRRVLGASLVAVSMLVGTAAHAALISCHNYTPRSRIAGMGVENPRGLPIVAHKSLPFGTIVRFRSAYGSVDAIVKDRGPYYGAREYDLDCRAMGRLGIDGVGHAQTQIIRR